MSPFRLFGPPPEPQPAAATFGEPGGVTWAPGPWAGDPAPATRHSRPVGLDTRPPYHRADDDPPTDPHGFPPVPATPLAAWPPVERPVPVEPPPDPREAAALAGAFATDYLSWDEDDPARRARVLAEHLGAPAGDPALLGWDGVGRQRAEFALPGAVRPDGDDRVLVDVRVRVTPYRAAGDRTADEPGPEPHVPGAPAAAPAPAAPGWRGCASYWVRLIVPVVREDGRLVVDAREETLPEPGPPVTEIEPEFPAPGGADGSGSGPDAPDGPTRDRPVARVPDHEPEQAW